MIRQTIAVEDIMSLDLIKSTGSWKNAKKYIKRLFDICLENGFLKSWEFNTKKKVDSYRSLHRAKIHLYYANAYSAARFPENLQRALMILDEEIYVKQTVKALDYVDKDLVIKKAEQGNLEDAKDLVSAVLTSFVDAGKVLDWDVEVEPDNLEDLLNMDVILVFLSDQQRDDFLALDEAELESLTNDALEALAEMRYAQAAEATLA